jgi:hypothetical protein
MLLFVTSGNITRQERTRYRERGMRNKQAGAKKVKVYHLAAPAEIPYLSSVARADAAARVSA